MTVTEEVPSRGSHCCPFGREELNSVESDGREELLNAFAMHSHSTVLVAHLELLNAFALNITLHCIFAFGGTFEAS